MSTLLNEATRASSATRDAPTVRLPGSGGANDIASLCNEVIVATAHERRRFVEAVDFVTSPGWLRGGDSRRRAGLRFDSPTTLATELGTFDFEPQSRAMRLRALHRGVTVDAVRDRTGCELLVAEDLDEIPPPDSDERGVLRELAGGVAQHVAS